MKQPKSSTEKIDKRRGIRTKAEIVEFNGIRFYRYPNAKRLEHQRYYSPHIAHTKKGVQALHQEVWKSVHGPIPPGHHIHHKDEDFDHNTIDNLECLTPEEHNRLHGAKKTESQKAQWAAVQAKAAAWHGSPEGLDWHSEHGRIVARQLQLTPRECECTECHKKYLSASQRKDNKFCSPLCRDRERRRAGKTKRYTFTCPHCGVVFKADSKKRRYCSKRCARYEQNVLKSSPPIVQSS